jgi:hypothetical protein
MKDLDKILRDLRRSGWATVTRTKGGHFKITPADEGQSIIICPGTSVSRRSISDLRCQLRRAGYKES